MRRLALGALVGVVGFVVAVLGCGGPAFTLATAEEGGAGTDAAAADATEGPDGSTPDGARPGDAADASTGVDAGDASAADAGAGDGGTNPLDASPASFSCALDYANAIWCSDFDEQSTPPWGWPSEPVNTNGSVTNDTTEVESRPNAFAASNAAAVTGSTILAELEESLASNDLHVDYAFELFVKQYDTIDNPSIPVAQLTVAPTTSSGFSLEIVVHAGNLGLVQINQGTAGSAVTIGAVSTGKWYEVEMLLDRSAATWTATVWLDGVQKLSAQTSGNPPSTDLEVDLGILGVTPPTDANTIVFDNVLVRAY